MTELQQKEFELLVCFDRVCKELDLPYFLVCGSALGSVKYQGFIPWDDDIDVGMLRKDYTRFLEKAPALLPDHLFLQTFQSDPGAPLIYSKLRNSRTTFLEPAAAALPIHQGIFLDIFPLDGYPRNRGSQLLLELRKRCYARQLATAFALPRPWYGRILQQILRLLGYHKRTARTAARYQAMISSFPTAGSALICNHGNWQGRLEYAPASHYGRGRKAMFEGLEVLIPEDYDGYLTQKYGDWRADPPIGQQTAPHPVLLWDCHTPYTRYANNPCATYLSEL